jgi:hypothetical protein
MDRAAVKTYAPQARRDFIEAVTSRAAHFGLTADGIEPMTRKGEGVVIGTRVFPAAVADQRKALEARIKAAASELQHGFHVTVEALAYTWFNRLVAIRFMELHGYLENGPGGASLRVLSHPDGKPTPEILERADEVELPGLKRDTVIGLKLDGKEAELYRLLLVAQCNALHAAMPFLFEKVADESELVLPENLLNTDSLIRKLVAAIPEADWREEVEIIGWLYEAYNSERYAEVIGSVVACDDIPVATQKFTPKWVVQYLVQNTLGRLWLSTYPDSPLKAALRYYVEPAEQTPEVQRQLAELTPKSLNPEEITMLEPACGSGHILAVGYDVFKAIYLDRGYRLRDIPAHILGKNLVGLEIDERAAQLASFTLMMKARADDPRIFTRGVQPRVMALLPTRRCGLGELTGEDIADMLNAPVVEVELPHSGRLFDVDDGLYSKTSLGVAGEVAAADVTALMKLFENAHCTGSMIRIPEALAAKLSAIEARTRLVARKADDLFTPETAEKLLRLVTQAQLLARRYDCVVANPPYMKSRYFEPGVRDFVNRQYGDAKADLCEAFIDRGVQYSVNAGLVGMITMQSWMFLSSSETLRTRLLRQHSLVAMAHLGAHAFPNITGQVVQVVMFVLMPHHISGLLGNYKRLVEGDSDEKERAFHGAGCYSLSSEAFDRIPGKPVAYWVSEQFRQAFAAPKSSTKFFFGQTTKTTDNGRFMRLWWEPSHTSGQNQKCYRPFAKGGDARKWYGNREWLVRWDDVSLAYYQQSHNARISPKSLWYAAGITWTDITASVNTFRLLQAGDIPSTSGPAIYTEQSRDQLLAFLAFLNCKVASTMLAVINPTLHVNPQDVLNLPLPTDETHDVARVAEQLTDLAAIDWDSSEVSCSFKLPSVIQHKATTIEQAQATADAECLARFARMKELEEENNRLFIAASGLQDELSPEVPDDQITLYRPDRANDVRRLLSYIVGCVMGRYSLDQPGLVYAHGGNVEFDPAKYTTFPADADGIVPLLDTDWGFTDDAVSRVIAFVGTVWPKENLEANLRFLAESLEPKANEPARETIRRYFATAFFKDHLKTYKRRPIYWLFSSGKERAFQALVYLHRYHAGTLARMRTEYVIKLQGRIDARIEQLATDIAAATSTAHRSKLTKEQGSLKKQQAELLKYDELLRHTADRQIALDLDDGVKVNYAKFDGLLAESKAICGAKDED